MNEKGACFGDFSKEVLCESFAAFVFAATEQVEGVGAAGSGALGGRGV